MDPHITTVINLKGKKNEYGSKLENAPPNVIYIGRRFTMGGWNLSDSDFGNPFAINKNLSREQAVEQYKEYIINKINTEPEFKNKLFGLKGKVLACWCTYESCHGDILREIIEGKVLGDVVCGMKPGRGQGAYPIVHSPNGSEYVNIPAFSRGAGIWKTLSPFTLKPGRFIETMFDGALIERDVTCIENLWQNSKIEERLSNEELGLPPKEEWFNRRNKGWADPEAHRHVLAKADRTHPSLARHYWNGKYISYEEARKLIYIPFYWKAAIKTEAFKQLVDMRERGVNFQIIGPDGRNIKVDLHEELKDLNKPFGHELVLVAMLTMSSIDELLI